MDQRIEGSRFETSNTPPQRREIVTNRLYLDGEIWRAIESSGHFSTQMNRLFYERQLDINMGKFDYLMDESGVSDILARMPKKSRLAEFRQALQRLYYKWYIGRSTKAADAKDRRNKLGTYLNRFDIQELCSRAVECGLDVGEKSKTDVILDLVEHFDGNGLHPSLYAGEYYVGLSASADYAGTVTLVVEAHPLSMEDLQVACGSELNTTLAQGFLRFAHRIAGHPVTMSDIETFTESQLAEFNSQGDYKKILQNLKRK